MQDLCLALNQIAPELRQQPAGESHGAQTRPIEEAARGALDLGADEAPVEPRVVRDENVAAENPENALAHRFERGRVLHHPPAPELREPPGAVRLHGEVRLPVEEGHVVLVLLLAFTWLHPLVAMAMGSVAAAVSGALATRDLLRLFPSAARWPARLRSRARLRRVRRMD